MLPIHLRLLFPLLYAATRAAATTTHETTLGLPTETDSSLPGPTYYPSNSAYNADFDPLLHATTLGNATSNGIGTSAICAKIKSILPGRIFYANDPAYNASQTYFTAQEREMTPSCIFRPETAEDVSAFVKLAAFYGTKFAIRSGGHTLFRGAANIDDGITVDMRRLEKVVVSEDSRSASVGMHFYPSLGTQLIMIFASKAEEQSGAMCIHSWRPTI